MQALIWNINTVALCALIVAFLARRAWRTWRWFGLFLLVTLSRDAALYAGQDSRRLYFWIYVAFEPIVLISSILAVMEIWRARTASLFNVGQAGRYFVITALIVATVAVTIFAWAGSGPLDTELLALVAVRQWSVSILGVFALAGNLVLKLLGSVSSPAVVRQHLFISLYFGLQALAFALDMLLQQSSLAQINIAMLGAGALIYGGWTLAIENAPVIEPPQPGPRAAEVERQVGEFMATLRGAAGSKPDPPAGR